MPPCPHVLDAANSATLVRASDRPDLNIHGVRPYTRLQLVWATPGKATFDESVSVRCTLYRTKNDGFLSKEFELQVRYPLLSVVGVRCWLLFFCGAVVLVGVDVGRWYGCMMMMLSDDIQSETTHHSPLTTHHPSTIHHPPARSSITRLTMRPRVRSLVKRS